MREHKEYPPGVARKVQVHTGEGKTEQAHKEECDVNKILKDYHRTGLIRHAAKHEGKYDDVPAVDFQSAMILVANAQQMFEDLPAATRKRFGNDPGAFLGFVQDPDNTEELKKMGVLRGNDGLDISGAKVNSPVQEPVPLGNNPDGTPVKPQGDPQGGPPPE